MSVIVGYTCTTTGPSRLLPKNIVVNDIITHQIVFDSPNNTDPITETVNFTTASDPSAVVLLSARL